MAYIQHGKISLDCQNWGRGGGKRKEKVGRIEEEEEDLNQAVRTRRVRSEAQEAQQRLVTHPDTQERLRDGKEGPEFWATIFGLNGIKSLGLKQEQHAAGL